MRSVPAMGRVRRELTGTLVAVRLSGHVMMAEWLARGLPGQVWVCLAFVVCLCGWRVGWLARLQSGPVMAGIWPINPWLCGRLAGILDGWVGGWMTR